MAFSSAGRETPRQVADWLHPSTQAIGSSAVVCGSARSSSSENFVVPRGVTTESRQAAARATA